MRSRSRRTTPTRARRSTRSRNAGVRHAIGFNYRRLPAVSLMAEMIANGELGDIHLWRGHVALG